MSIQATTDPACSGCESTPDIAALIDGKPRDIGGFDVRRLLPSVARRQVGPFVFFDHMGPATLAAGQGLAVRPHPHVGLATVTYLVDGEILHRDSLGSQQAIRPGAVNWMTAGRGIVHSERSSDQERCNPSRLNGLQLWVALPTAHEETDPAFHHHPSDTLPLVDRAGARLRVLAGEAFGAGSPVPVLSPLFYVEARLPAGGALELPDDYAERALYVVEGSISCGPELASPGRMLIFETGRAIRISTERGARVMLFGGEPLDGERHIWWNLVSSSKTRIEKARQDWQAGRFPTVPGDELEFTPAPSPAWPSAAREMRP